jgi:hypothetical protein
MCELENNFIENQELTFIKKYNDNTHVINYKFR